MFGCSPSNTAKGAPTVLKMGPEAGLRLVPDGSGDRFGGGGGGGIGIFSFGGDNFRSGLKLSAPAIVGCDLNLINCGDDPRSNEVRAAGTVVANDLVVWQKRQPKILPATNIVCPANKR